MDISSRNRIAKAFKEELVKYRDRASRLHCEYLLGNITLEEYCEQVDILDDEYATAFADSVGRAIETAVARVVDFVIEAADANGGHE